ncbi:MAG: phosphocholine cytidylyltransferase family protein [Sandaracinus sp.]|nr:phosphocholine cytidylyltransferase family protein [Sandaracinus sp.]MCB9631852.1 phosphocholine cytidylyltransferase family protein [Sandaracinus sp.]
MQHPARSDDGAPDLMDAVILAAGTGTRLRPLTDDRPKCMVSVLGKPMLEHALGQLEAAGIETTSLVTGYLSEVIEKTYGDRFGKMALRYLPNPEYATTNNIVSLLLAKDAIVTDTLLLEADLVYDDGMLAELASHPARNVALVDRFAPPMDGTVIVSADGTNADRMVLKVDQGPDFVREGTWKTVNLYKLSGEDLRELVLPRIDAWVKSGRTQTYYEAVFAELVAEGRWPMAILPTGRFRWAEVDDVQDLAHAEKLFGFAG